MKQSDTVIFTDMDGTLLDHHTYSFAAAVPGPFVPLDNSRAAAPSSFDDGFEWPVLEMAEYEFGDEFGAGGAREVALDHALIVFLGPFA